MHAQGNVILVSQQGVLPVYSTDRDSRSTNLVLQWVSAGNSPESIE
jgi:hypothetical protein